MARHSLLESPVSPPDTGLSLFEATKKRGRPKYIISSVAKLSAFDVDSLMRVQLQKIF